ncbi:hypothetical protein [Thermococcus camini]|uniref:Uncharacterized protein n=1 Tax=Thermococcus camini TaxID=2016373 RepID=A0A7G2D876_9EURY|nr:hypothetical protein [Thermococcus camini]CAD5244666.1 conserved protein of unknown function [Thermococcus camini]
MLVDMETLSFLMEMRKRKRAKRGAAERMLGILEGKLPKGMTSVKLIRKLREEEYD